MAKKKPPRKSRSKRRTLASTQAPAPGAQLLRRPAVQTITSLPRATIYDLMAVGKFPHPVRLSPGRVAWVRTEIDTWLADRIAARGGASNQTSG